MSTNGQESPADCTKVAPTKYATVRDILDALENCRLYAARHRKEDWAKTILRFCSEAGVTGSVIRD